MSDPTSFFNTVFADHLAAFDNMPALVLPEHRGSEKENGQGESEEPDADLQVFSSIEHTLRDRIKKTRAAMAESLQKAYEDPEARLQMLVTMYPDIAADPLLDTSREFMLRALSREHCWLKGRNTRQHRVRPPPPKKFFKPGHIYSISAQSEHYLAGACLPDVSDVQLLGTAAQAARAYLQDEALRAHLLEWTVQHMEPGVAQHYLGELEEELAMTERELARGANSGTGADGLPIPENAELGESDRLRELRYQVPIVRKAIEAGHTPLTVRAREVTGIIPSAPNIQLSVSPYEAHTESGENAVNEVDGPTTMEIFVDNLTFAELGAAGWRTLGDSKDEDENRRFLYSLLIQSRTAAEKYEIRNRHVPFSGRVILGTQPTLSAKADSGDSLPTYAFDDANPRKPVWHPHLAHIPLPTRDAHVAIDEDRDWLICGGRKSIHAFSLTEALEQTRKGSTSERALQPIWGMNNIPHIAQLAVQRGLVAYRTVAGFVVIIQPTFEEVEGEKKEEGDGTFAGCSVLQLHMPLATSLDWAQHNESYTSLWVGQANGYTRELRLFPGLQLAFGHLIWSRHLNPVLKTAVRGAHVVTLTPFAVSSQSLPTAYGGGLPSHSGLLPGVTDVAFSSDVLVTLGQDGTVRLINMLTGKLDATIDQLSKALAYAKHPPTATALHGLHFTGDYLRVTSPYFYTLESTIDYTLPKNVTKNLPQLAPLPEEEAEEAEEEEAEEEEKKEGENEGETEGEKEGEHLNVE